MKNQNFNLERIEKLIAQLPEVYQSIYVKGELIREGVRKNDWERLQVIKQYIKPEQTILDIGSNVGFFTIELAKFFPNNVFVTVEKQRSYARLQAELIALENLKNVVLINSEVTVDWLKRAAEACSYVDVTLLLSVLHHMKDAEEFLSAINKISKSLIIEMPHPDESRVCGKDVLKNQLTVEKLSLVKPYFRKLDYEANTHCDPNLKRAFYYVDSPDYERKSIFPYIGYPLTPREYLIKTTNEGVTIHKSHLSQDVRCIPGFLLSDVAQIGKILYPKLPEFKKQVEQEFDRLDRENNVADIRPWNLLFTAKGLKFIDFKYTQDLDRELKYDKHRDTQIVNTYLDRVLGYSPSASPRIIVDGVFFQLYSTGIARVWRSLLQQWTNTEFAAHIIVLDRTNTTPKISGIRYRQIPAYTYNNTDADKQMLQQVCDEEGADLFISTYYTTPISTPSVFMAYDMIPEVLGANFNEPMWREKHHAIGHASSYISISESTARDLVKFFPDITPDDVTVAHCGVAPTFTPATTTEISAFKHKYGISKPYFLLVGAGSNYKNAILFFRAFAQLHSKQGFEIVCTGSGVTLANEYRQYASGSVVHSLILSDEELKVAYSGAVALVYPSLYEGFGMPVAEALACACPVITCANASIPEVVGEAAIYVDGNDVDGLTDALCEVQKPKVRNSLIAAGLEQAKKFSWGKMADIMSTALMKATLGRLNLRDINLIIFPDWTQLEETVGLELQKVMKNLVTHPDRAKMTLLIDNSNITAEDADLILSSVAMNLLMEEELEIDEGPEIVLVGELSQVQWSALIPQLQGRIKLEHENGEAIAQIKAENIPIIELNNLARKSFCIHKTVDFT